MSIFFDAVVAFAISLFILRKSQTPKRHVLGFLLTGILSGIVAFASFEISHPCAGANCTETARFNATLDSLFAWVLGFIAGFVLGAVVAKLRRPKAQPTSA